MRLDGKGDADQVRPERVQGGGLGVKAEFGERKTGYPRAPRNSCSFEHGVVASFGLRLGRHVLEQGGELELAQEGSKKTLSGSCRFRDAEIDRRAADRSAGRRKIPAEAGEMGVFDQRLPAASVWRCPRAWASRFSMVPYSLISAWAVFSPMPGTPGMLSEASPISPMISTTRSGPYAESLLNIRWLRKPSLSACRIP